MKVLVVGSGGREHALAWKLRQSPHVTELYCVPGNAGTATVAQNLDIDMSNLGTLALWAVENQIDLTVVGPEAPLADGLVDVFADRGLKVFGPSQAASQLETSKAFAKDVMNKAGVPNPKGQVFTEYSEARAYIEQEGAPIVIKADGLAAGKGVTVAETLEQALAALDECMQSEKFGDAGKTVVVEECLKGREASVMAIVDGDVVLPLVVSQDYKRLLDGDRGPNTGGMGAISPTPVLADQGVENLVGEIFLPVISELMSRGIAYRGFLYAGVMVDSERNVKTLEFNCRLGDPETQVLMMRMNSDLFEVLDAAASGKLSATELSWRPQAAACVVAASEGYPEKANDGKQIDGIFHGDDDLHVFQAGTTKGDADNVISKGGRVLCVSALGKDVAGAVGAAYEGLDKIKFEGMHYRRDIGGGSAQEERKLG